MILGDILHPDGWPLLTSNQQLRPPGRRAGLEGFKTMLCVPGDLHRPLYLIHTGAVALLDAVPEEGSKEPAE